MKIQILDKTKKKKFIELVSGLGVEKIPYLLIKTGKERIRAFSGSLSNDEIYAIWRLLPIEGIGLYFGKEFLDARTGRKEARLSIDALHVLKEQINKNIIDLDEEQEKDWFKGGDINLTNEQQEKYKNLKGFVAVESSDENKDFIGTGKIVNQGQAVSCFLPKERRVKN